MNTQSNSAQISGQTTTSNNQAQQFSNVVTGQGPSIFCIVIDREQFRHIRISPEFDNDIEAREFLSRCDVLGAYLVKINFWS